MVLTIYIILITIFIQSFLKWHTSSPETLKQWLNTNLTPKLQGHWHCDWGGKIWQQEDRWIWKTKHAGHHDLRPTKARSCHNKWEDVCLVVHVWNAGVSFIIIIIIIIWKCLLFQSIKSVHWIQNVKQKVFPYHQSSITKAKQKCNC